MKRNNKLEESCGEMTFNIMQTSLSSSTHISISTARVKVSSTQYGRPLHKFYWVLDKETIVELVEQNSEREIPLPPPWKLNLAALDHIAHMTPDPATEIDILAVVVHCGPPKYAGRGPNRCREIIVTDNQCMFQIDLIDGSGSTTAMISGDVAEKMLSMTAEDIFDTTCVKG